MKTHCRACPLRTRPLFVPLTEDEIAFMERLKDDERTVERGRIVLHEGESSPNVYTVLRGMGTRSKMLATGQRQVINFVFPGDFVGLQSSLMGEMKHSVEASTDMVLCTFRRADLWTLFNAHPARAYDLTWIAAVEEHFLGETIATLGQRDAMQRMAWALLRMYRRLRAVDLGADGWVPLPFRQLDLADALGLSLVHTNKTLGRLRQLGLARLAGGRLTIPDRQALADLAQVEAEPAETRPIL